MVRACSRWHRRRRRRVGAMWRAGSLTLLLIGGTARVAAAQSLPPAELPPAEVLSFEAAVSRSLARNPAATIAIEEIARVRGVVEEVRAASLPTLTANAIYTRLDHDRLLS